MNFQRIEKNWEEYHEWSGIWEDGHVLGWCFGKCWDVFWVAFRMLVREEAVECKDQEESFHQQNWLVVEPTHLKNISQIIGSLSQVRVKIKNVCNHHLEKNGQKQRSFQKNEFHQFLAVQVAICRCFWSKCGKFKDLWVDQQKFPALPRNSTCAKTGRVQENP